MVRHEKIRISDLDLIEIDIKDTPEGIKFSLVLIRNNKRLIGFDNHEHHMAHKHIKNKVFVYDFVCVDKLIEDFYEEISHFLDYKENE